MIGEIVRSNKHARRISLFDALIYLATLLKVSAKRKTLAVQEAFSNVLIQAVKKTLNYVAKVLETEVVNVQDRLVSSVQMETVHLALNFVQ